MNTIQIGKEFEEKALPLLKNEGYKIIDKTSSKFWQSAYDLLVSKNGKEFCVEIRGRKSGGSINNFSLSTNKIRRLKELKKRVLIMLINSQGYEIFPLNKINQKMVSIQINNKRITIVKKESKIKRRPIPFDNKLDKLKNAKKIRIETWKGKKLIKAKEYFGCGYCDSTYVYVTCNRKVIFCRRCGKESKK